MSTEIRRYVRELDLDAYVVGGSVRDELLGVPHTDEDFLVPGVDQRGLRALLEPHGRVEDMEVHGQLVGVRLHPRDAALRVAAPKGIEFTPPRAERSTGPSHREFEIVTDGSVTIEDDLARRDFTVNAMALRLADGTLVDPFGGRDDLRRRELRTVRAQSFAEDPLRILRGLRLVSQLGFALSPETLEQMRLHAPGLRHVSAERIGGGLAADGMGELSKLLHGVHPARALRLMRDTGALAIVLPEAQPSIGYQLDSPRQPRPVDEHDFAVVQNLVGTEAVTSVRLAALLHDLGKPEAERTGDSHAVVGARLAAVALRRLRYPVATQRRVVELIRCHAFELTPWIGPGDAGVATRRFLRLHGLEVARELVLLKRADLQAKSVPEAELAAVALLAAELERQASAPYRVTDLAVNGHDLEAVGFVEGPVLGRALESLLDLVVEDPSLNRRETLLERAAELA